MVRIAITPGFDNDNFFTKEQSIADLEATPLTLTLDGATLPTIRKPITMLNIGFWKQRFDLPRPLIAFPTGSIFSPAALSIGDHTAGLVATDPVFGTFLDSSTFAVITWDTPKGMFTASPFGLSHQTSIF